jgi:hypothetical protein
MKARLRRFLVCGPLFLFAFVRLTTGVAWAQWPFPPVTPNDQRNAVNNLRSQLNWFQNATRTAPNFGAQGYGQVHTQFDGIRGAYEGLKHTLSPRQLADGANALAELDAGLDIIQEAFANYENDVAAGRPATAALRDMCEVMRQATQLWAQELNKTCSRFRIGY